VTHVSGLEFVELDPAALGTIAAFIARHQAAQEADAPPDRDAADTTAGDDPHT
jgi:hypothetical protein